MMDRQILDNELPATFKHVLNAALFKEVHNDIMSKGWFMNNSSYHDSPVKFWTQNENNRPVLETASNIVKKKIENYLKVKLNHIRTHLNGQTFGQNGQMHTDYVLPGFYTFLLFCNLDWDLIWGGETCVITPKKEIKYFNVSPNDGVLFPSNWNHKGNGPTRETYRLRVTLAFSYCIDEHLHKVKNGTILPEFLEEQKKLD
jgi:hypothetical protein